jgi:hypothetical protein
MGKRVLVLVALAAIVAAGACATGAIAPEDDAGSNKDATSNDVITTGDAPNKEAGCTPPTIKCAGDAQTCVDITKDPNNCGQCGTVCAGPDAGPEGGNGNPDAGIPIPDGGIDGGNGWSFPNGSCTNKQCQLDCGDAGTQLCSDDLCWDMQNSHEHCGSCTTACAADVEWCTHGHCCSTGTAYCGGSCVSTLTDGANCGSCGNVCPSTAPVCVNGTCSVQVSVTTVCSKSNPSGIFCGGNCTNNHAQYADAYCKLAGYTKAASYTVLTTGSVTCLYYQTTLPTTCAQILGPTTYGLATTCDAIQSLKCQ